MLSGIVWMEGGKTQRGSYMRTEMRFLNLWTRICESQFQVYKVSSTLCC
jgi:hypothetical protein